MSRNRRNPIRRGDKVRIKAEWRDPGDEAIEWVALENESGGRVRIQPLLDLPIRPNQVVTTGMVERRA